MIENAKKSYLLNVGKSLAQKTSTRAYWSLINKVLNKNKVPSIPPLLENGIFVTDFSEKRNYSMIILRVNAQQLILVASSLL